MPYIWLLATSMLIQTAAAILALRFNRITGRRRPWLLISAALFLMLVRRGFLVAEILAGDYVPEPADQAAEWLGLATSVLLLAGVAFIGHLFQSIRKNTDALRASEAKYRELVENANSMILRIDPESRITFFNEGAERFFGYPKEEILGRRLRGTIVPETDASGRNLASMIQDIIQHPGREASREVENMRRNGARVWVSWMTRPLFDRDGRLVEVLAIGNDVTQRRLLEEQFRQSHKMEALGRLAGGVAHDFNNLLTGILGYAELLANGLAERNPLRAHAVEIVRAGERAASLTRQLLAFSRKQFLQPRPLDLNRVIREMENLLRRMVREDIEMTTSLGADLGMVRADQGQIEQVIMNLVVNARDAMPDGGRVRIETANANLDRNQVSKEPDVEPGPCVMLAVSDTGTGIDDQVLPKIFEPFFTTKEEGQGTGLGLSTVFGIVRQSGGIIRIFTTPGKGSTFRIWLPRVREEVREAGLRGRQPAAATSPGESRVVLLAEDDAAVRTMVRKILQSQGYFVFEASTGEEALEICTEHPGPIDLLVTDVVMPFMNGTKLAQRVASLRPSIRVLFLSGYPDSQTAHPELRVSGAGFLQKPFVPTDLVSRVRELLDSPQGDSGEDEDTPRPEPFPC